MNPGFSPYGYGLLLWVPSVVDVWHPTVAELSAGMDITYDLSDFIHDPNPQTRVIVPRSRAYVIEVDGGWADTVEVTWPYSRTQPSTAQTVLVPGARGFLAWRLGYPKGAPVAVGQVFNAVIPVRPALPRDVPTGSGVAAKVQKLNVTGEVGREVVVV